MSRFTKSVERQGRTLNKHARHADRTVHNNRYPFTGKGSKRLHNEIKRDFHNTYARHVRIAEKSR